MPKFRYAGEEPRIYSELPYALGEVHPGDEHEFDTPPDFRWEGIGNAAKKAAKAVARPAEPKPSKAAAKKPQTDQPVAAPAEPAPGIDGNTNPLAQPASDPSDA